MEQEITNKSTKNQQQSRQIDFNRFGEILHRYERGIERKRQLPYSEAECKKAVTAIGQSMLPSPSRFMIDSENNFVFRNILKWCNADPSFMSLDPDTSKPIQGDLSKGLYLCGGTGSGKTFCLQVFRAYLQIFGIKASRKSDGKEFPLAWRDVTAQAPGKEYMVAGEISSYFREPSLCLQDIGAESREAVYMGSRIDTIGEILQVRGDNPELVTVISSNDRIRDNIYGDRVTSRLVSMCNYYELTGHDRRLNSFDSGLNLFNF